MRSVRARFLSVMASAAVLAVVLAACGSNGADPGSTKITLPKPVWAN